jgi:NADH-quinone oxidoreductase subunit N
VVFRAAIEAGFVVLAIIGVLTSAIAAYYYFMVIKTMFMEERTIAPAVLSTSRPLAVGLFVMVLATVFFGIFPNLILKFAQQSAQVF